jgi:hypothetical protein
MQPLGFRPYTITNGKVAIWITKHPAPNPLNIHQSITTDHATAVLSAVTEWDAPLTTFWQLLGWERIDGGFRRGSRFIRSGEAVRQFTAAKAWAVGE